ncbi:MAG: DNA repair protein RadC [Ignavibacteria bacterium]|nr:DNA repair protein RadC [Ignavibacteria bacterium]
MDNLFSRRSIRDLPPDDRPREKLLRLGPAGLTDAELLAATIRTGTGGLTALDLARSILKEHGSLQRLAGLNAQELQRIRGIGAAKSAELVASFEIGRRVQGALSGEQPILRSPANVAAIMVPLLRDAPCEKFHVLVLDSKNGLIKNIELTSGTLNASLVHPREVFKSAIDNRGASVIVVHNHPSGSREPSREDIEVTRQLAEAGKIIGIPLHDHVIVAGNTFVSLAEKGFC